MPTMLDRVESLVEKALPRPVYRELNDSLDYGGVSMRVGKWLVFNFLNATALSVLVMLLVQLQFGIKSNLFGALFVVILDPIIMVIMYYVVLYYGQRRAIQIEEMMPDALMLVSSNLRAEIPIHKSLILSARAEFGLLSEQLRRIGDELISGVPMDDAFMNFSKRVRSTLVNRVSVLIKESLRSGHDLAGLLEQIAHDIRSFKILEAEAKANISSYVLFIMMAVIVIAPVLYCISISFVDVSQAVRGKLDIASILESGIVQRQGGGLARWITAEAPMSSSTLTMFAAINLAVGSIVGAFVVSVLQTGEVLQKLHLVPVFLLVSMGIFFVGSFLLKSMILGSFGM